MAIAVPPTVLPSMTPARPEGSWNMRASGSKTALTLAALAIFVGGCATSEYRMAAAADRDDARRTNFEHCRAEGRSDCDAILNAPVNSNTRRGDSVREQ